MQYALFPYLERKGEEFVIERPEQFGGTVKFKTYDELEKTWNELADAVKTLTQVPNK